MPIGQWAQGSLKDAGQSKHPRKVCFLLRKMGASTFRWNQFDTLTHSIKWPEVIWTKVQMGVEVLGEETQDSIVDSWWHTPPPLFSDGWSVDTDGNLLFFQTMLARSKMWTLESSTVLLLLYIQMYSWVSEHSSLHWTANTMLLVWEFCLWDGPVFALVWLGLKHWFMFLFTSILYMAKVT